MEEQERHGDVQEAQEPVAVRYWPREHSVQFMLLLLSTMQATQPAMVTLHAPQVPVAALVR